MKHLLIGTVSAMLIALPLYANVGTSSPNSASAHESGDTQMMEESATPGLGTDEQRMEETPSDVPATETNPTGDQQRMEEDSAFESDTSTDDVEMQEDSGTESEM
jgi:hypothetical protein